MRSIGGILQGTGTVLRVVPVSITPPEWQRHRLTEGKVRDSYRDISLIYTMPSLIYEGHLRR